MPDRRVLTPVPAPVEAEATENDGLRYLRSGLRHNKKFPVMEIFGPVIQGEGAMAGQPTMFIRFGGCDYRCLQCDSMHAVDPRLIAQNASYLTAEEIGQKLRDMTPAHIDWVTLSGGNPLIWDVSELVKELNEHYMIAVETQGTIWRPWVADVDCLTISPKGPGMGEHTDFGVLDKFMDEVDDNIDHHSGVVNLKIVCFDSRDLDFAEKVFNRYPSIRRYLSVGNSFPRWLETHAVADPVMQEQLLRNYRWLTEETLKRPKLFTYGEAPTVLPQLHVLMYGNELGR